VNLLQYIQRQLEYDAWANHEVLAAMQAGGNASAPALKLLAHILSAERLWLERLTQQPQTQPVWPDFDIEQAGVQLAEVTRLWRNYSAQLSSEQLSEKISYKNSKGEAWSSIVQDVLTHLVMHSAYHRGQIASVMRAAGNTPAFTDFIHAVRQGFIADAGE
jgi:uncharacterized damage-inducible protein DinB